MDDWRKQLDRYKEGGRLSDKPYEDMLGRRILRGLGGTERQVYKMERAVFGNDFGELSLWVRASRMFEALLQRTQKWGYLSQGWHIEPIQIGNGHKDALERIALSGGFDSPPVLFAMPKHAPKHGGFVYSLWSHTTPMDMLEPPYEVLACHLPYYRIVVQDVALFVRQFGPYELSED